MSDKKKTEEVTEETAAETEEKVEEKAAEEPKEEKKTDKKEKAKEEKAETKEEKKAEAPQGASDAYLRLLAEYDNYRKRSQKEKDSLYADIKADTVTKFLPRAQPGHGGRGLPQGRGDDHEPVLPDA